MGIDLEASDREAAPASSRDGIGDGFEDVEACLRSARRKPSRIYECRTHFISSGKVGFLPYIRMPTR